MLSFLFFLSSGLFLGWSLGANDGANIFGTAVGTKMIKFRTAAIISSVFVILGAVIAGSGASQTLNKLGSIDAIPGAFMAALAAGVLPFIPGDLAKMVIAAVLGPQIRRRLAQANLVRNES